MEAWPFVLWQDHPWLDLLVDWGYNRSLSLQEDLLGLKTKVFRRRGVGLLVRLRVDCPSSLSSFSLWGEKKRLGIGSCLWCVIDYVLTELLLLLYFSNLIIGAILSWWEIICIWTVSCSSSVTQGVPEETKTARVHMVWKRTPCSSSNMCGSADRWDFFSLILKGCLMICLAIANVTIIIINGSLLPIAANLNSFPWH